MIRKALRLSVFSVPMVLLGLAAANSRVPSPDVDEAQEKQEVGLSTEEQRKLAEEAQRFAEAVASQDSPEYYRTLEQNLLQLRLNRLDSKPEAAEVLRAAPDANPMFIDLRRRVQEQTADLASLYNDKTWQANYRRWQSLPRDQPLREVGGYPVQPGGFPDCVAVGSAGGFCCSGTLVGSNVVLTAAHCVRGGCASRVYIGNDATQPGTGTIINVKRDENGMLLALVHPSYNPFTSQNDVALLILERDVDGVTPRRIATSAEIDGAFYLSLVGFGYTSPVLRDYGIKNKVDVVVASNSCNSREAQEKYGCNADLEIVAGGNGVDSCNGDSGGPAYLIIDGEASLAGVTSRATRNSTVPCGDGGTYARADRYIREGDPLYQQAKEKGAAFRK